MKITYYGGVNLTKNKFEIKREITHAKLIDAGFNIFCEKGYSGTSIDEIVLRAGYTKGAFYVHFESKEQFFFKLIELRKISRADLLPQLFSLVNMGLTLEEIIHNLVKGLIMHVKKTPEWIVVYVDFFNQVKHNDEALDIYQAYYKSWIEEIDRFINLLVEKEYLPPKTDSLKKAKAIYAYLDGYLLHSNFYKEVLNEQIMAGVFLAILND